MIPDYRQVPNTMTEAHRANAARREAIPLYVRRTSARPGSLHRTRTIALDARTGNPLAVWTHESQ